MGRGMSEDRSPRLARQIPLPPPLVDELGVREDGTYESTYFLLSPLRAALWSGSAAIARAHAELAATIAERMEDPAHDPAVLYLGRGLSTARSAIRARAQRTAREVGELIADAGEQDPDELGDSLAGAFFLVLPWYSLGLGEPTFAEARALEDLAGSYARRYPDRGQSAREYLAELAAWRDLAAGRPEAVRLLDLYDPRDDDALEELGWEDLPAFELIYAVDRLRAAGIGHSLAGVRTLPPLIAARGGWWA